MSFSIPTIIPKYRFWGAFIALMISSAIFVSAFTLMFSLNNAGEDIFGTSEDILVYYNSEATTPFTSIVPEYLAKSFEQIEAVEVVNPEIFQPVVIKDSTAYIRGTNYSNLIALENGKVIDGNIPDSNQIYHALIGKDLSKRLRLSLNDTVVLESIVSDQHIPIKIVGKYESGKLATTDELLVSKEVARAIGGQDEFSVTHIRVKFDHEIMTREEIISQALKLYKLQLNIQLGNNSAGISQHTVKITDQANQIVFNDGVEEKMEIDLFAGNYIIQIYKSNNLESTHTISLDRDIELSFDLNNYLFNFHGKVAYNSIYLPNAKYEIRDLNGFVVNSGLTDDQGEINLPLLSQTYTITIFEGTEVFTEEFNMDKPSEYVFNIDSLSIISLEDISNGTLITKNNFVIQINGLPQNLNLMIDDLILTKSQSQKINTYQVSISALDGMHELKVIHNRNPGVIVSTVTIEVDSTIKLPVLENYFDGSHYRPQDNLQIETRGMFNGSLISNIGNLNYISQNSTVIELPSEIGFYLIHLEGQDIFGNNVFREYNIIIEDNPPTGGWKERLSQPYVKEGDQLDVWMNVNTNNIATSIGAITNIDESLKFTVPSLPIGNHTSIVSLLGFDSFELNFTVVDRYSSLFSFNNLTVNTSINPNLSYDSSYFSITYLNQSVIDFSTQWDIMADLGQGNFSVFPHQNISIPGDNEIISSKIFIKSKLTSTVELVNMNFTDPSNAYNFINLPRGFPTKLLTGQFNATSIIGGELSYYFNKSGEEVVEPINLENNIIQLSPGNYTANFTDSISQISLQWNFEIPNWINTNSFFNVFVSYDWGHLTNFTGSLVEGTINVNGVEIVFESSKTPNINYFRNIEDNQIEVQINNVIQGNYTVNYSNGTDYTSSIVNTSILISQGINNAHLNFTINTLLMTGRLFNSTTIIDLDISESEFTFILYNATSNNISGLQFRLYLEETRETIDKFIIDSNSTFSLSVIPQENSLVIWKNEVVFFDDQIDLLSNLQFELFFGTPVLNFNIKNLNYGINSSQGIITINEVGDDNNSIFLEINDDVQLPVGEYEISVRDGRFNKTIVQHINSSNTVEIQFDLRVLDLQIKVNDLPLGDFSDFTLHHKFLLDTVTQAVNTNDDTITILNFPLGPSIIKLNGSWGLNEYEINILQSFIVIDLVIEGKTNILSDIDFRFAEKVGNLQLGASVGDQYLDSFLEGSLIIAKSIFITEIAIILIIIITNIIEIFAALTYESKREIAILRNLGSTPTQTVLASTKFLLLNSLIISLFGQALGAIVIRILLDLQYTVYFGHQFYPELFITQVFLANIAIVIFLTFLGAFYNVRKEYEMNDDEIQK